MSMCISTAQTGTRWGGLAFGSSEGVVWLSRCALFLSNVHFVWQASDVRDIVSRGRFQDIRHFSSAWQGGAFWTLLKNGRCGQNERCFWRSFCLAGAEFGELGGCFERVSKVVFCEAVVIFGFEHDDGFVWQVQHFGCLGSFLVAGAVLCRPRQKMAET